jgi:peptide/nickel transport system substrate-binding protein
MLSASDVDFLDPGRTYYTPGYQVALATQRPLYSFRPADPQHPVPDLAAGPPRIGDGGRTVTVRLRSGVRFSPPVRRAVTSDDVAYALQRGFSASVANPYTQYFQDLVGVPAKPTPRPEPIAGIRTPDARTIVFRLRRPTAAAFATALIMPVTAPVPREYARRFDAKAPSTYNTHLVATGPYMVRNDAAGKAVGYRPGRSIELVRNPEWRADTDARPAYLDRIEIETNRADRTLASKQVFAGRHLVLNGAAPPALMRQLASDAAHRSVDVPVQGFRYLPINTAIHPFDDVLVRRAIQAAFDRHAARQVRGGTSTGELATHFLPPGIPGFAEAGGRTGPGFDFLDPRRAGGDLALARRYLRRAGYAAGRYDGKGSFLMVGPNSEPDRTVAELAKDQLERLGFHIRLRLMAYDTALVDWCQRPERKVAICAGLTWSSDFPDPASMMELAFAGFAIEPANNGNMAQLRDPRIDRAMRRAETLQGGARARAWGRIDRMITAQAPGILLQWDRTTLVRSRDVAGVPNRWFIGWDLAYTGLR